jgi:hypothetical protein
VKLMGGNHLSLDCFAFLFIELIAKHSFWITQSPLRASFMWRVWSGEALARVGAIPNRVLVPVYGIPTYDIKPHTSHLHTTWCRS